MELVECLHPFGDRLEAELVREVDHRTGDRLVLCALAQARDEEPVELEDLDGNLRRRSETSSRCRSRHSDPHTEGPQIGEASLCALTGSSIRAVSVSSRQSERGRKTRSLENPPDDCRKVHIDELAAREVDRKAEHGSIVSCQRAT